MNFVIHKAHIADILAIAKMHKKSFVAAYTGLLAKKFLAKITEAGFVERWTQRFKKHKVQTYIAENNNKVIGLIAFTFSPQKTVGEINLLYVDPGHWHEGIGKKLMLFVVDIMKKYKVKKIHIWVLKKNHKSRLFYESLGAYTKGAERLVVKNHLAMREVGYWLKVNY